MNDLLKDYKEMVPMLSDDELERQYDSMNKFYPDLSNRDMRIFGVILVELISRIQIKLFSN